MTDVQNTQPTAVKRNLNRNMTPKIGKKDRPQGAKPKGSKYAKKRKGKKAAPRVKRGEPVFLYYVQGTDIRAVKTPCERDPEATKDKPSQSPLGTWRDPRTGKKCKVTRVRNKPEVHEQETET